MQRYTFYIYYANYFVYLCTKLRQKTKPMKKTLLIESHSKLFLRNSSLIISKETEKKKEIKERAIPLSDIDALILESQQITITTGLLNALLTRKVAIVICDSKTMPKGVVNPLVGNVLQTERQNRQLAASAPLKKQMWQFIIKCKIINQANVLSHHSKSKAGCLHKWGQDVKSGDNTMMEARAAQYYWSHLFDKHIKHFKRSRDGEPPNNVLNYGYSVIRLIVIKNIITTGLLPSIGLHHSNKYNPFCLADDLMEPYRPYIDHAICQMLEKGMDLSVLNQDIKGKLFGVTWQKVKINGRNTSLSNAITISVYSFLKSIKEGKMHLLYPEIEL